MCDDDLGHIRWECEACLEGLHGAALKKQRLADKAISRTEAICWQSTLTYDGRRLSTTELILKGVYRCDE